MSEKAPKRAAETICRTITRARRNLAHRHSAARKLAARTQHSPRAQVTQRRVAHASMETLGEGAAGQPGTVGELVDAPRAIRRTMDEVQACSHWRVGQGSEK